jgi:predicted phage terminase large subunit-like protein
MNIDAIQRINTGVDLSFGKTAKTNDFNAWVSVGWTGYEYIVLSAYRARLPFPQTQEALLANWVFERDLYGVMPLLVIEDKGNGSAMLQTLESQYPGIPTHAAKANSKEGKYDRSLVVQPWTDRGFVCIYDRMPGREMFCHELNNFPQEGVGFHDDLADAFVHAMRQFLGPAGFKKPSEGIDAKIRKQAPVDVVEQAVDLYLEGGFSDTDYRAAFNKPWGDEF